MTDNVVFTNNASALLAANITAVDTTIQVASGFGALFPSPTGGKFFYATLEDDSGNIEIVKCTARSGDNLTVVRAQDGTTAQAFTLTVTRVEIRLVKVVCEEFLQKNGGTMTGNVDFNGNNIVDAVLSGPNTAITAGEIYGVPIRNASGVSANEIAVPASPGRATVGGSAILASGDDIVAELDTAGVIILDSATVGVRIPASAYLRVEGSTSGHYFQVTHDDTDVNFAFGTATELNIPLQVNMADNELVGPIFVDWAVKEQSVTATATTNIDYTSGSYVNLALNVSISTLNLQNPPASNVGSFRLKITQGGTGSNTISWPAGVKWPVGTPPPLSTAIGAIDVVDLWTDDGGTTWYGDYATGMA